MKQDIDSEIKRIEVESAQLEKRKTNLLKKQMEQEKAMKKLDGIVAKSGFKNAKQLIEALMVRNNISPSQLGRKKTATKKRGRTRTTVTAKLRDAIADDLASGMTKTDVGKKHGVSYPIIRGVEAGKYSNL